MTIIHGDCLEVMQNLGTNSVDAVVSDPPYGLSFMGKRWDYDVPSVEIWAECLRVLKPGGHLLAFAGTRTQHRMAVRIEDAGFEIRDMIAWVYGSGFPKSHNLQGDWQGWGTALKPALEPITVARKPLAGTVAENVLAHGTGALNIDGCRVGEGGKKWETPRVGIWSTDSDAKAQLVDNPQGRWPANLIHDGSDEVVGLFPQSVSRPVKPENIGKSGSAEKRGLFGNGSVVHSGYYDTESSAARFFKSCKWSDDDWHHQLNSVPPASGAVSPSEPCGTPIVPGHAETKNLDFKSGALPAIQGCTGNSGSYTPPPSRAAGVVEKENTGTIPTTPNCLLSSGCAAHATDKNTNLGSEERAVDASDPVKGMRFLYSAKASKRDRDEGLEGFAARFSPTMGNGIGGKEHDPDRATPKRNVHPTVKPTDLMRYLVRLVTPPGGVVLDPFCGSGSTGKACALEGFEFIGIEREAEYVAIAMARIEHAARQLDRGTDSERAVQLASGQHELFQ